MYTRCPVVNCIYNIDYSCIIAKKRDNESKQEIMYKNTRKYKHFNRFDVCDYTSYMRPYINSNHYYY